MNSEPKATYGFARNVKVRLGESNGLINLSVVPMDDYPVVLGMEFMDQVKAILVLFANTMCIMEKGNACMIPLTREANLQAKTLSAMQVTKCVKKGHTTYLVALKEEKNGSSLKELPMGVIKTLEEFEDVMPPQLPKKLPSK